MWFVAPLEMNEVNSLGARVQSAYRLQCRKSPTRDLNFNFNLGTRLRGVVKFIPPAAVPLGKSFSTHWIGGWVGPRRLIKYIIWKFREFVKRTGCIVNNCFFPKQHIGMGAAGVEACSFSYQAREMRGREWSGSHYSRFILRLSNIRCEKLKY